MSAFVGPNKAEIAQSFSAAAPRYDQYAFIQQAIGERLFERLALLNISPKTILDLGGGTGYFTKKLQEKFPHSQIISLDLAQGMMQYAKAHHGRPPLLQRLRGHRKHPYFICGDMEALPFKEAQFDLIFSNLSLQWSFKPATVFQACKKILKNNGVFLFSTLGPHTLQELRQSWAQVDDLPHVNPFFDMHDLGDALLNAAFKNPVMDMELITLQYNHLKTLLGDLKATGAHNMNPGRAKNCTPKSHLAKMIAAYEKFKTPAGYPATFEVLYGHARHEVSVLHRPDQDGLLRIPGNAIPRLSPSS